MSLVIGLVNPLVPGVYLTVKTHGKVKYIFWKVIYLFITLFIVDGFQMFKLKC